MIDNHQFVEAISSLDKIIASTKNETEKNTYTSLRCYCYLHSGHTALLRATAPISHLESTMTDMDRRWTYASGLSHQYSIKTNPEIQHINFELQKIDAVETFLTKFKPVAKAPLLAEREEMMLNVCKTFFKFLKNQAVNLEALYQLIKPFCESLQKQKADNAALKNVNGQNIINDRIHRQHGQQLLVNMLAWILYLSGFLKYFNVELIKEIKKNEFIVRAAEFLNPRTVTLLELVNELGSATLDKYMQRLFEKLCDIQDQEAELLQLRLVSEFPEVQFDLARLAGDSFYKNLTRAVYLLIRKRADANVRAVFGAIGHFQEFLALFEVASKHSLFEHFTTDSEQENCVLFKAVHQSKVGSISEQQILQLAEKYAQKHPKIVGCLIINLFKDSELSESFVHIVAAIIEPLKADYFYIAYRLELLLRKTPAFELAKKLIGELQTAHGLWLTAAPLVYQHMLSEPKAAFAARHGSTQFKKAFMKTLLPETCHLIHHTKEGDRLEFSQLILGGAYFGNEQWNRVCDGAIEAIFKNINPLTAVRSLEGKKYVQKCAQKLFAEAIFSVYQLIDVCANHKQSKSILSHCFEGYCGGAAGNNIQGTYSLYSSVYELIDQSMLYFIFDQPYEKASEIVCVNEFQQNSSKAAKQLKQYEYSQDTDFGKLWQFLSLPMKQIPQCESVFRNTAVVVHMFVRLLYLLQLGIEVTQLKLVADFLKAQVQKFDLVLISKSVFITALNLVFKLVGTELINVGKVESDETICDAFISGAILQATCQLLTVIGKVKEEDPEVVQAGLVMSQIYE